MLVVALSLAATVPTSSQEAVKLHETDLVPITRGSDFYGVRVRTGNLDGTMLINTGSAYSYLPLATLQHLGASETTRNVMWQIGGTPQPLPVYKVERLQIGDCRIFNAHFVAVPYDAASIGLNTLEQLSMIGFDFSKRKMYFVCPTEF